MPSFLWNMEKMKVGFLLVEKVNLCQHVKLKIGGDQTAYIGLWICQMGSTSKTVAQLEWLILWPCGYCVTSLKSELKGPSCKFIFKDQIKIDLSVWVTIN